MLHIAASRRHVDGGAIALPSLFFRTGNSRLSVTRWDTCQQAMVSSARSRRASQRFFATRWTPLHRARNDDWRALLQRHIRRGVPLISRAAHVARLRELEDHGVIETPGPRGADGAGHEYWLTPAGEGLHVVMHALGQWGMTYTHRTRIKRSDLDPQPS